MAIINGQLPSPSLLPDPPKRRVVVKFKPHVQLPYSALAVSQMDAPTSAVWRDLVAAHPGIELLPYFATLGEGALRTLAQRAPRVAAPIPTQFTQYFAVRPTTDVDADAIARLIAQWPTVELAYVEGGPVPPPVNPADDPLSGSEGYLTAAPAGLDARFAWNSTDGSGIGFVDLERGWTLNHEDLAAAGISLISGLNQDYPGHGTAVLGEVLGVDNTIGGIGIAPSVHARVVSQWRSAADYNTAEAILSAVAVMRSGDVLQLEAQTNALGYANAPVEVEAATFDAIQYAVSQGIIVIEAGGNGSIDLDTVQDASGKTFLNRGSTDFRDSGAILVGAASSLEPHSRLSFSNFGSRIDCYAWGENITTCGDGWTGNLTNSYTNTFGGTSGATPMVTGSALLVQSWRVSRGLTRHLPDAMRSTLSAGDNTPSADPATDRIGVMPNLKSILNREARSRWIIYLAWAWMILIGGLLITPGGVLCVRCGPQSPGFIGDIAAIVLGGVSVALGIFGVSQLARHGANTQAS